MKKTLRLIGIAIVAIFFSVNLSACSDDDDDDFDPVGFDQQDPNLIGAWEFTQQAASMTETEIIEFYADGTYSETDIETNANGTIKEWEKGTWNTNVQKTQVKLVITDSSDRKEIGNVDVESYRVFNGTLTLDGTTYAVK